MAKSHEFCAGRVQSGSSVIRRTGPVSTYHRRPMSQGVAHRREEPFFHRATTKEQIEQLSSMENLLIYAGAGVTADRTGKSWADLVRMLFESVGLPVTAATTDSLRDLGALPSASAAFEAWAQKRGAENVEVAIADALRPQLYQDNSWRGGQITRAIGKLAVLYARLGRKVVVATTNYDRFILTDLEIQARVAAQDGVEIAVNMCNLRDRNRVEQLHREAPTTIDCLQLHGLVERDAGTTGFPVVAESQYLDSRAQTEAILTDLFESMNVLIVGSGLTDQPLLSALLSTRDAARRAGLRRLAVVSGMGNGTNGLDEPAYNEVSKVTELRLNHFGTQPVFADYFSHVGQLLTEVGLSAQNSKVEYPRASYRYGERLMEWSGAWQRATAADFTRFQADDHVSLCRALEVVRERAAIGAQEVVKAEVWLRWEPANQRAFRLWASSFAQFTEFEGLKSADIRSDSKYAAVQAFCEGRPKYFTEKDLSKEGSRWKTFLAAPIALAEEMDLPVGAIVLASQAKPGASALSETRQGQHAAALEELHDVARTIALRGR